MKIVHQQQMNTATTTTVPSTTTTSSGSKRKLDDAMVDETTTNYAPSCIRQPPRTASPPATTTAATVATVTTHVGWNNMGVDMLSSLLRVTREEVPTSTLQYDVTTEAIRCFRKALSIARRQTAQAVQDIEASGIINGNCCNSHFGFFPGTIIPHQNDFLSLLLTNKQHASSSAAYTSTRLFTVGFNSNEDVMSSASKSSVIPHAVIIFNLATIHYVMGLSSSTTTSSVGDYTSSKDHHPQSRLRQCIKLYQCCWRLLCKENQQNQKNAQCGAGSTAPKNMEMLGMACLNNMASACYEMADYQLSRKYYKLLGDFLQATATTTSTPPVMANAVTGPTGPVTAQHHGQDEQRHHHGDAIPLAAESTNHNNTNSGVVVLPTTTRASNNIPSSSSSTISSSALTSLPWVMIFERERYNLMLNVMAYSIPNVSAPAA